MVVIHDALVADPGVRGHARLREDRRGLPLVRLRAVGDQDVQAVAVGRCRNGTVRGGPPSLAKGVVGVADTSASCRLACACTGVRLGDGGGGQGLQQPASEGGRSQRGGRGNERSSSASQERLPRFSLNGFPAWTTRCGWACPLQGKWSGDGRDALGRRGRASRTDEPPLLRHNSIPHVPVHTVGGDTECGVRKSPWMFTRSGGSEWSSPGHRSRGHPIQGMDTPGKGLERCMSGTLWRETPAAGARATQVSGHTVELL